MPDASPSSPGAVYAKFLRVRQGGGVGWTHVKEQGAGPTMKAGLLLPASLSSAQELAAKDAPAFICHWYNLYFAHTAGGLMIGKKAGRSDHRGYRAGRRP